MSNNSPKQSMLDGVFGNCIAILVLYIIFVIIGNHRMHKATDTVNQEKYDSIYAYIEKNQNNFPKLNNSKEVKDFSYLHFTVSKEAKLMEKFSKITLTNNAYEEVNPKLKDVHLTKKQDNILLAMYTNSFIEYITNLPETEKGYASFRNNVPLLKTKTIDTLIQDYQNKLITLRLQKVKQSYTQYKNQPTNITTKTLTTANDNLEEVITDFHLKSQLKEKYTPLYKKAINTNVVISDKLIQAEYN